MLHEKSCGAIVYRKYHGNTEILLISISTAVTGPSPRDTSRRARPRSRLLVVR